MSEDQLETKRISRRSLINVTGTTLALGAVSFNTYGQEPAQRQQPAETFGCRSLPPTGAAKPKGKSLDFVSDEGFRNEKLNGKTGFQVRLRVPYYRSTPMDQILDITVSVDGERVKPEDITCILDGNRYKVPELRDTRYVYWHAREYLSLFIEKENGLSPGEHEIEVSIGRKSNMLPPGLLADAGKKRMTLQTEA